MIEVWAPRRRALGLLLAALVLAGCGEQAPAPADGPGAGDGATSQRDLPVGTLVIRTDDGPVRIEVEIAETPEQKARGLMGRRSLPEDAGMVFLEEQPVSTSFWMKDTLIPLSIAFWGPDGEIRRILDMEPCREEPCPLYDPETSWVGAVEVNQGFFREHGVEEGDTVELRRDAG
ncbi:MAG TPA: DUF192 domain-containing protein [Actinomycetota bacterium]|nr:DUF192 domain-containing protein [Actinomycetota bacterium]